MKKTAILTVLAAVAGSALADVATITALDLRSGGAYGHNANIGAPTGNVTINGSSADGSTVTADPIDMAITYNNLNLDGDATANDTVTFTLRWTKTGPAGGALRIFNQGVDTGFGNLNDTQISMLSVSGTTTDNGDTIVFDGFTGAALGAGGNGDITNSATINGTTVLIESATTGAFQFKTAAIDFAPTATVTFDNSSTTIGTIVARHYDLQFSTIPEPATLGLISAFGGAVLFIRRRFMI